MGTNTVPRASAGAGEGAPTPGRGPFHIMRRHALRQLIGCGAWLALVGAGAAAAADEGDPRWHETLAAGRDSVTLADVEENGTYELPHRFLFFGSETVRVGDRVWERGVDYRVDYDAGTITVLAAPPYAGPPVVEYEYLPFLQSEDYRRALESEDQAEELERLEEAAASPSQLDVTGSKTFTVRAGNVEGTDNFDQSLRLSIRGNVGDVKVTGEISDQDLPIEGGGGTEEIEAVDKISVRVEGRHLAATFGDYDAEVSGRRFADYRRRLTGIAAEAFYPTWEANAYGARARGRFASNEFYGADGVQGPYQLRARDDDEIIVLPGTETVWLNGVQLKEGENNDYLVDYDLATITFTVRRPISAQDRIVVDFQYTTEEYQRDFFGATADARLARDAVSVGALYLHEEDDRDRDFFGLGDYRKWLEAVGDDEERARVVARDENGDVIYEYVGEGQGEYTREWDPVAGKYVYLYVGAGNGDYMPKTILLPLPKRQSLFDVTAAATPSRLFTVEAEGATSDFDGNTFSVVGDADDTGLAGSAAATVRLGAVELFRPLGRLDVRHVVEGRDGRFRNLGREDGVAFLQDWDLEDEVAGLARPPGYNMYETTLTESPAPTLSAEASYGGIRQRYVGLSANGYAYQKGKRFAAALAWEPERWPHVNYDWNFVRRGGQRGAGPSEPADESTGKNLLTYDENTRREQNGKVSYALWRFNPYVRIYDKKRRADYATDGVPDEGTLDQELEVGTGVRPAAGWNLHLGHTAGRGKEVDHHAFVPHYRKNEENVVTSYEYPGLLNASAEYTRTDKDFYSADEADVAADLSLVEVYYTPLERALSLRTRYQLENVQEFEREEIFEVAPDRDGDYRREVDPKNPNRFIYIYDPEDPEAIYIKKYRYTGRRFRVLEPDATLTLGLQPFRVNDARGGDAERSPWLDAASADLYVHARNSSTSEHRLAVALLQDLLAEDALDSSLEQRYTLTLLPVNRRLTARARYSTKDDLTRTVASRQVRDWRTSRYGEIIGEPVRYLTVQADVERVREWESIVEENVPRPQNTEALEMIYGLEPTVGLTSRLDVKARLEVSRRHEGYNGAPTRIAGTLVRPEATYRLAESGVVNAWYERAQYDVSGYAGSETLLLRLPGVTHTWEASVNKGVGQYVTLIFTYDGERRPDEETTRHRGQIDLNIYF